MTLKHYLNKDYPMEGTYLIQLENLDQKEEILNTISTSFNLPMADLSRDYSRRSTSNMYVNVLKILQIVMFVSLAITIVFYVSKLFTKIGIYKLNGYTNFDIWLKLILPTILLQLGVLIIISIGSWIVLKNIDFSFMISIIKQMGIAILITLICSYLLFYFVKQYSISKLIKGENLSKLLIRINRFIRIASLTLITILFSFVICKMDQYKNMEKALSYWNKYSDYAMLNYYQDTNTATNMMNDVDDETLKREQYEYYKYLESIDAFSVSAKERNISRSIYFPDIPKPEHLPKNYLFYEMKVNTTYFDTLGIKDMEGQDIKVDIKDPVRYTLIPKSKEKDLETIQFTLNMEENKNRRLSDQQLIETKYLIYDDTKNNKFFSFNVHINENDGNMLTSPIITVFNSYSGSSWDLQVEATGINSTMKIPMQGKTIKEFNEMIQPMATQIMPEKTKYSNPVYFTVEGIFDEQNAIIAQGIREGIVLFVLVIILYVIISFQSNELYLNANSKRLAVLKLSGYSFKDRYQKYLSKIRTDEIILTIVYIAMIAWQSNYFKDMMMVSYKASKVLYVLFIPLVLIDYVMTKLVIRKKEIKNLNKVLKGE